MERLDVEVRIGDVPPGKAADVLARASGLPKSRIKDAMTKGAVWLRRPGRKEFRLRRATFALKPGDRITLHYDQAVLDLIPPEPELLTDLGRFSLWIKPAGLLTQGSPQGDHCCLLRQVELRDKGRRPVHPVHRLDREAVGLVLLAHDGQAAARLSALFRSREVAKTYLAQVLGNPGKDPEPRSIDLPLDGQPARTLFAVLAHAPGQVTSWVRIRLDTGRTHQIRRHFEAIGHPVMGDPRYGRGNANTIGLQLFATELAFTCPFTGRAMNFTLPSTCLPPGLPPFRDSAAPPLTTPDR